MSVSDNPRQSECRIVVKGTNDVIELIGRRAKKPNTILFILYINDVRHDYISFKLSDKPLAGILDGNPFALHGTLYGDADDDVPVRIEGRDNGYTRPEYSFYVGDQEVYNQKGLPRRF